MKRVVIVSIFLILFISSAHASELKKLAGRALMLKGYSRQQAVHMVNNSTLAQLTAIIKAQKSAWGMTDYGFYTMNGSFDPSRGRGIDEVTTAAAAAKYFGSIGMDEVVAFEVPGDSLMFRGNSGDTMVPEQALLYSNDMPIREMPTRVIDADRFVDLVAAHEEKMLSFVDADSGLDVHYFHEADRVALSRDIFSQMQVPRTSTVFYSGLPLFHMRDYGLFVVRNTPTVVKTAGAGLGRGLIFSAAGGYTGGKTAEYLGYEFKDGQTVGSFAGAEGLGFGYEMHALSRSGQALTGAKTAVAARNASAWMFYVNVGLEGADIVGLRPQILGGKGLGETGLSNFAEYRESTTPTSVVGYVPAYINALNSPVRSLGHTVYGTFIGIPRDFYGWGVRYLKTRRMSRMRS